MTRRMYWRLYHTPQGYERWSDCLWRLAGGNRLTFWLGRQWPRAWGSVPYLLQLGYGLGYQLWAWTTYWKYRKCSG